MHSVLRVEQEGFHAVALQRLKETHLQACLKGREVRVGRCGRDGSQKRPMKRPDPHENGEKRRHSASQPRTFLHRLQPEAFKVFRVSSLMVTQRGWIATKNGSASKSILPYKESFLCGVTGT